MHEESVPEVLSDQPSPIWRLTCTIVAILPFCSVYLAHSSSPLGQPTGFIQGDMPYYCANGRAIFERGNGFAHPNPFDPDPHAPVIYFHWLTWVLGVGITKWGLSPAACLLGIGALGAFAFAWLTSLIVETVLPQARFRTALYFFVMWGGGLLCIDQMARNLIHGLPIASDLLAFDPFNGWWFLNWGRNLVFPTEAVYHALVAAAWLGVLRQRWGLTLISAALLATTHPFSGLQLLLMLEVWFSLQLCVKRSPTEWALWLSTGGMLALFAGYYFIFLEGYPQHRALRHIWSLEWTLPAASMLLAYGPIGAVAAYRFLTKAEERNRQSYFFATCFLVSLLMAKHEWFVAPRQPLHFTRGYVWMPLCMIALPALQRMLITARQRLSQVGFVAFATICGVLAVSDNACFLISTSYDQWYNEAGVSCYLSKDEQAVLSWIGRQKLHGVLACTDDKLSYLSAVYSSVRPYYGHWPNTPDLHIRREQVRAWFEESKPGPWMETVDYFLLPQKSLPSSVKSENRPTLYENTDWILLGRARSE
jgi:hypothetical protein